MPERVQQKDRTKCKGCGCDAGDGGLCRAKATALRTHGVLEGVLEPGSEELGGAVGGNNHVVFAAKAEFTGDVDAGLVGKSHAGFEDGFAGADEIGMLVAVKADAVPNTVGEEFVVGAEASLGDDGAGGIVNGAGKFARAGRIESDILRFSDCVVGAKDFLSGLAKDAGAGDVGIVALDGAPAVNQDHIAFL